MILEDKAEAKKRREGSYGQLTGYRHQNWGFEYRTLPSFIVSPEITTGILAMAKVVANEVIHNGLSVTPMTSIEVNSFRSAEKGKMWDILKLSFQMYNRFSLYNDYKNEIKKIFYLLRYDWSFKSIEDIKQNWDIPVAPIPETETVRPAHQRWEIINSIYEGREATNATI